MILTSGQKYDSVKKEEDIMSNDIKRFIKSAAIVAAAALSGSHANAQPKETNAADQHIQYMQTNEPKYSFDDDRCSNLLEFVVAESGRSQSECTSMLRKYIAEMNKFYCQTAECRHPVRKGLWRGRVKLPTFDNQTPHLCQPNSPPLIA